MWAVAQTVAPLASQPEPECYATLYSKLYSSCKREANAVDKVCNDTFSKFECDDYLEGKVYQEVAQFLSMINQVQLLVVPI
jgi:hypothetical protein